MIVLPPTSYLILLIPIPPFQIKENYEIIFVSFCVFLLESFDVFWIFLLLFSMLIWFFIKISPHFYNQIKQGSFILPKRITNPCTLFNPNKPKGLFNFCEVKIFGCVTHISVQDQFRISCVWHGFIFCTIKTYKISMKVLDWNKFNYFCVDTRFQVLFVQSFVPILVKQLKYSLRQFFLINFILGMFLITSWY